MFQGGYGYGMFPINVPNIRANDQYLNSADYGRVGALKLANSVFGLAVSAYTNELKREQTPAKMIHWKDLGEYHFFQLGKSFSLMGNEGTRADLNTKPDFDTFAFTSVNLDSDIQGPVRQSVIMGQIAEAARIYGFPVPLLTASILTLIKKSLRASTSDGLTAALLPGYNMAKYNPAALDSLWGVSDSGYPMTYYSSGAAAKEDFGGGRFKRRKGRRRGNGKRKRKRFY